MLIRDKKHFFMGSAMAVVFFVVLGLMFMPLFDGENAMEASDHLFNSISKASTDHFPAVEKAVQTLEEPDAKQTLAIPPAVGENLEKMLAAIGQQGEYSDDKLEVSGDLKVILEAIVQDSKFMFDNNSQKLESTYGIPGREAMYAWWIYLNTASKALMLSERFKVAKVVGDVKTRAVEVGYNYYGVEPTPVSERIGIMTFALVFYVVYTLWWGFSIFFLCEGIGLVMSKSKKQET